MAPKAKADAKAKAKAQHAARAEVVLAKDFSNFVTQMTAIKGTDPFYQAKMALYKDYQSMSLRDARKGELVRKYFADKTCSWRNTHSESVTEQDLVKQKRNVGYGTECLY